MNKPIDYEKLKVKEYKYWSIFLHKDQTNIGRTYLWCNRKDIVDFLDMNNEEKEEFFKATKELKDVLTKLFKPDLFNYASLGNDTHHLHVHIIPRYASPREFQGITFEDKRWGHSYRTNQEFKITNGVLFMIKDEIKKFLK